MNQEFINALRPFLVEEGELCPYLLQDINGWPNVAFPEEMQEDGEDLLDTENFSYVEHTETTLTVCCGGDWQEPHTVVIAFVNGQVIVESCEPSDFNDNVAMENEIKQMFNIAPDEIVNNLQQHYVTLANLHDSLKRAIATENYEEAARIRDEITKQRLNIIDLKK